MICARCHQETNCHTMSMFNRDEICMACKQEEMQHSDYHLAVEADEAEIRKGNYNFPGIGWDARTVTTTDRWGCERVVGGDGGEVKP